MTTIMGWVDIFGDWIDGWLRKRRGMAKLKIWRDKRGMHGNTLFNDAIRNALKTSALFFALISRNYLQSDYCRKEISWFHQYCGQRQFLRNCENRPRELDQYELVKCLQTEFVNLVLERITHCRQPASDQSANLSYLIDTHQKDQRFAFRLADFLLGNGAEVDFNHESQDPTISLSKFEQSVKCVKNLILICGRVGPAWVLGRIKKAFKAISEQFESEERSTLEYIWVFLAPAGGGRPDLLPFPP